MQLFFYEIPTYLPTYGFWKTSLNGAFQLSNITCTYEYLYDAGTLFWESRSQDIYMYVVCTYILNYIYIIYWGRWTLNVTLLGMYLMIIMKYVYIYIKFNNIHRYMENPIILLSATNKSSSVEFLSYPFKFHPKNYV